MDGSLLIGLVGVLLGAGSLGWQAATYALTGGRVKVSLRIGAIGRGGMVTAPSTDLTSDLLASMAAQGFPQPVAAVRVANVGRLPVTVAKWGLESGYGISYYPIADSIGSALPRRLDVGESEMWAVDLATVQALEETAEKTLGSNRKRPTSLLGMVAQGYRDGRGTAYNGTVGLVELADGRSKRSPDALRINWSGETCVLGR